MNLVWVYLFGGALELFGIGLVAWDVRDAHLNVTRRLTPERMQELLGGKMPNQFTLTVASAKLVAGNVRRRLIGVLLLAIGLVVQVAGNIAAL
jgi:hypothetical protein